MSYRLLGQAKSRLIHLKHSHEGFTQLRGFVYDFEITLPPDLMEYAYYCGLGEYPYLGFGYVDLREEVRKPADGNSRPPKSYNQDK
jgi:CRISPR/Cas system endoribonuclease Cas6 (RAMP superfamily)